MTDKQHIDSIIVQCNAIIKKKEKRIEEIWNKQENLKSAYLTASAEAQEVYKEGIDQLAIQISKYRSLINMCENVKISMGNALLLSQELNKGKE